jgi:hypothetical protein
MTSPKLSLASSGFGGRGYADIFGVNGGTPLMSITTALGSLDKPGVRNWERQQIAAFAVTHLDEIAAKEVEVGYRYLMAVPKFLTPEKHDELDYGVDLWNAAEYALDEAANAGTWIHTYIEDHLLGKFPEDPIREDHYQMVQAFHAWEAEHDIEVLATERTVYGDGYAGTADLFAKVDGVVTLIDWKSSSAIRDSHKAQLAAIGAAITTAREVSEGTEGAIQHKLQPKVATEHGQEYAWFVEEPLPDFQQYAVGQVRPDDYRNSGEYVPAFCEMHVIPQREVDAAYKLFIASRDARLAQRELKEAEKGE